jgi:hypothetical protein
MLKIVGLRWLPVRTISWIPFIASIHYTFNYADAMIDFGFVISSFVPLVLLWM